MYDAEVGPRRLDRLFKVWRKTGEEDWILIHLEIQNQEDATFPQRMFVYHFRIFEKYGRRVVSLAILGDERPAWRPSKFEYNHWGCKLGFEFPTVKLLDFANREAELETSTNVFAAVVQSHLKSQQTRGDAESRRTWKLRIVRGLYERGWTGNEIRKLFVFVDWVMQLPRELEHSFLSEVFEFEREKQMPYVTSAERFGIEKGLEQGRQEGRQQELRAVIEVALDINFGVEGTSLIDEIRQIEDLERLRKIYRAVLSSANIDEVRPLIAAK